MKKDIFRIVTQNISASAYVPIHICRRWSFSKSNLMSFNSNTYVCNISSRVFEIIAYRFSNYYIILETIIARTILLYLSRTANVLKLRTTANYRYFNSYNLHRLQFCVFYKNNADFAIYFNNLEEII